MKLFFNIMSRSIIVAVIAVLLIPSCDNKKTNTQEQGPQTGQGTNNDVLSDRNSLPIAYVNIDTLLTNYNLAKDANESLMRRFESSRATINEKQRRLESEYKEFERKLQANAFLSEERARSESNRLQNLSSELEKTANRLDEDLRREQQRINNQLADSVRNAIKIFNQTANYELILSNSGMDNVLFAKDKYDVTSEVLSLLNKRYTPKSN